MKKRIDGMKNAYPCTCHAHRFSRDDLKAFALVRCHDIFDDYSEAEVRKLPPSVQGAWEVGRDLAAQND